MMSQRKLPLMRPGQGWTPVFPNPGNQYRITDAYGGGDRVLIYGISTREIFLEHSTGEMWSYSLEEWLRMRPELVRG